MNLDELINSLPKEDLRADLKQLIREWKLDETDIHHLAELIEAWWQKKAYFNNQESQSQFFGNFQTFKSKAIGGIGGMTVNERLYWFGLFEEWDTLDKNGKERIRQKLHAPV